MTRNVKQNEFWELILIIGGLGLLYFLYIQQQRKKIKPYKEEECRKILESIFGVPFPRVRPSWLVNPKTGHNLELDCYNQSLKLALEYNGIQHYKHPNFTGQSKEEFERQQERDEIKRQECQKKNIKLIEVPYNIPTAELETFIRSKL
jgi:hypothetical protein